MSLDYLRHAYPRQSVLDVTREMWALIQECYNHLKFNMASEVLERVVLATCVSFTGTFWSKENV